MIQICKGAKAGEIVLSNLHGLNGSPGSLPELADAGVYEEIIRREDGQWDFFRRGIAMDASSGNRLPDETFVTRTGAI